MVPRRRNREADGAGDESSEPRELGPRYFDQLPDGTELSELAEIVQRSAQKGALWAVQQLKWIAQHGDKNDVVKVQALRLLLEVGRLYATNAPLPAHIVSSLRREQASSATRIRAGNVLVIDSGKAESILRQKRIERGTVVGHGPIGAGAPAAEDPPAQAPDVLPLSKSEQTKQGIARARAAAAADDAFWNGLTAEALAERRDASGESTTLHSPASPAAAAAEDVRISPADADAGSIDRPPGRD